METNALENALVSGHPWVGDCSQTSFGSRTEASQSMALRPRMPPNMFSTYVTRRGYGDDTLFGLTLTSPTTS
jgi:hypothetical protein